MRLGPPCPQDRSRTTRGSQCSGSLPDLISAVVGPPLPPVTASPLSAVTRSLHPTIAMNTPVGPSQGDALSGAATPQPIVVGAPDDPMVAGTAPLPPTHAAAAPEQQDPSPRSAERNHLPDESPGRMVLPSHRSVFVLLKDVSRTGCCVVRKGSLALNPDDRVRIEMWREDIQTKASFAATVRWVKEDEEEGLTRAGLRFIDTSVKTQRLIDLYVARSFAPPA